MCGVGLFAPDHGHKGTGCRALQLSHSPHPKGLLPQTVSLMHPSFLKLFVFLLSKILAQQREK